MKTQSRIKKRINRELFIDERGALYLQRGASKNKRYIEGGKIMGVNK